MREFLDQLEQDGEVIHVTKAVSPRYEIPAIVKKLDGKCVVFDNIEGFGYKGISGLVSSRERIATALGCVPQDIITKLANAIENPSDPEIVDEAPCQEIVENPPDADELPICLHSEEDGGPYIASGIVIAKDPELGLNASFHRLMRIDKNRFAIRILPRHLHEYLKRAGGELDVAICIGNHPSMLLAGAISTDLGKSELAMANTLRPLQLVKCKTVDIEVPAASEIVIEARITSETAPEGPFIDLTGTEDIMRQQQVLEVKAITHRRDPYYHILLPGGLEHKLCMGLPREPTIYLEVNKVCRCRNVHITPGGCSWFHGLVQIEKQDDADPQKAIEAAFRGHPSMKHVFIVDEDVDIFNPQDIEWAFSTRFQGSRGLFVYENQLGSSLDPSANQVTRETTKVGFDLTIPSGAVRGKFLRAKIPGEKEVDESEFTGGRSH
ncbi:MAG TPA: UbiD family decarboxylase [Candidatus Lokiarchaeia archaeon]|nr:UbiD family decarboxylase [Candidatus Lokiarchaeia archaeon]